MSEQSADKWSAADWEQHAMAWQVAGTVAAERLENVASFCRSRVFVDTRDVLAIVEGRRAAALPCRCGHGGGEHYEEARWCQKCSCDRYRQETP